MEFTPFVITTAGQALMAKLLEDAEGCALTSIALSDTVYTQDQLAELTALEGVRQTVAISLKAVQNETSVAIEGTAYNTDVTEGYEIQTIGILAEDPEEGEILYAAARAVVAGHMPAYNGSVIPAIAFRFVITVGNAEAVEVVLSPGVAGNAVVMTTEDPGAGTSVSYPDGTVIHVYE